MWNFEIYRENFIERLLSKRIITVNGCWEYTGHCGIDGYGTIYYINKTVHVHRISQELFKPKEFNKGLKTLHKCNNKKCFNPEHLYTGDGFDNMKDLKESGNNFELNKTHCPKGHEYTEENTYVRKGTNRKGHRECRICIRDRAAVAYIMKGLR